MQPGNLFTAIPATLPDELFETLTATDAVKIERIVSRGHASPEGFWYDQEQSEWVLVLRGEARLQIEGRDELIHLSEGMYFNIPAHLKHRVAWTKEDAETIWLAVFY